MTTASASGGFTPHTTDEPPPNGHDHVAVARRTSRAVASSSASVAGGRRRRAGSGSSRLNARVRSVKWAPCEWNARSHVSVVHQAASESGTEMRDGRSVASSSFGTGLATIAVPARSESLDASSSRCCLVGSSLSRHQAQNDRRGEATSVMPRVSIGCGSTAWRTTAVGEPRLPSPLRAAGARRPARRARPGGTAGTPPMTERSPARRSRTSSRR